MFFKCLHLEFIQSNDKCEIQCSVNEMFTAEMLRKDDESCQCILVTSDINTRFELLMESIQVTVAMILHLLEGSQHSLFIASLSH